MRDVSLAFACIAALVLSACKKQEDAHTEPVAEAAASDNAAPVSDNEAQVSESQPAAIATDVRRISISDLDLDKKTIPDSATLVVSGIYYTVGQQEWLGLMPDNAGAPRIGLITEDAPRDVRAIIQRCRLSTMCSTILVGHLGECEQTFVGEPYAADRCLFVTGVGDPTPPPKAEPAVANVTAPNVTPAAHPLVQVLANGSTLPNTAQPGPVAVPPAFLTPQPRLAQDACTRPDMGPWIANALNRKIGQPGGPQGRILSTTNFASPAGRPNTPDQLTCHGIVLLENGQRVAGTMVMMNPSRPSMSSLSWANDTP